MPNFHAWFPHTYMKKKTIFMSFRAIISDSFPPTSDNYALNFLLLKVSHLLLFYSFHGLFMIILCSESFVEYTFFSCRPFIHSFSNTYKNVQLKRVNKAWCFVLVCICLSYAKILRTIRFTVLVNWWRHYWCVGTLLTSYSTN